MFAYIKQDKLGAMVMKCVFISHLESVKYYKFGKIDNGRSKFIISRNVTLDETL